MAASFAYRVSLGSVFIIDCKCLLASNIHSDHANRVQYHAEQRDVRDALLLDELAELLRRGRADEKRDDKPNGAQQAQSQYNPTSDAKNLNAYFRNFFFHFLSLLSLPY